MANIEWLKQTPDKPLFSDLLWSRPENKRAAGKLLIVGGNSHSFAAVSNTYGAASQAGVGSARVVLPASLERALSRSFSEAEFAPATPSGSFGRASLATLVDAASWADGVLLAGDFGKNSETAILLESFIQKYNGPLTLVGDSLDYFLTNSGQLLGRPQTTVVAELTRLQRLLASRALIKHSMDLVQVINTLGELETGAGIITHHNGQIIVASDGQVSTTPADHADLIKLAAYASVWCLQQSNQLFETLTCAAYCYLN